MDIGYFINGKSGQLLFYPSISAVKFEYRPTE